jgi:hypothetical protein
MNLTAFIKHIFIFNLIFTSCTTFNEKEIRYYDNGKVWYEVNLIDGKRNGTMSYYYKNGNIKEEVTYINNSIEGLVIIYDSLGNKSELLNYKNNQRDGAFVEFFPNGQKKLEGFFKNNLPDSIGYQYYETGELKKVYFYKLGNIFYYKAYEKNGKLYDNQLPIEVEIITYNERNDEYLINIKLLYSIYDNARIGVIVGNLDEKNYLLDTMVVTGSKNLECKIVIKSIDIVTGQVFELKMPDNEIVGRFFFKHPLIDTNKAKRTNP